MENNAILTSMNVIKNYCKLNAESLICACHVKLDDQFEVLQVNDQIKKKTANGDSAQGFFGTNVLEIHRAEFPFAVFSHRS